MSDARQETVDGGQGTSWCKRLRAMRDEQERWERETFAWYRHLVLPVFKAMVTKGIGKVVIERMPDGRVKFELTPEDELWTKDATAGGAPALQAGCSNPQSDFRNPQLEGGGPAEQ